MPNVATYIEYDHDKRTIDHMTACGSIHSICIQNTDSVIDMMRRHKKSKPENDYYVHTTVTTKRILLYFPL